MPTYHAVAEPADTELFVDGRTAGTEPIVRPIPYYGAVDLAVLPDADRYEIERTSARELLLIDEPVTPWIFPLDFFAEMAMSPFLDDTVVEAKLVAPERADLSEPAELPSDFESFSARARTMRVAR